RRIAAQRGFEPFRGAEVCPGAQCTTDEELLEYLRNMVETLYHPTGTCKMGTDELAVVDPELRVRGIDGLRVADASVMPEIVTGNTNAPVMMIAASTRHVTSAGSPA